MINMRLKSLRKEKGMTQEELAQKLNVARTTISSYESNGIQAPYDKLIAMSEIFGVTVKYLTGESNSRIENVHDIQDIGQVIDKLVDNLSSKDIIVKLDGIKLNHEIKEMIAGQLKETIKIARYMNSK